MCCSFEQMSFTLVAKFKKKISHFKLSCQNENRVGLSGFFLFLVILVIEGHLVLN